MLASDSFSDDFNSGELTALPGYERVKVSDLVIDDGRVTEDGASLLTDSSEVRATLRRGIQRSARIEFVYLGPFVQVSHLASGDVRHQFGLKLRAQNTCNLVYVMWRFDKPIITVAVKRNPGRATHAQCRDRGYSNVVQPVKTNPVGIGESHTLEATLNNRFLTVTADGRVMWTGNIGRDAMEFDGPFGLRSDNVRVRFDFLLRRTKSRAFSSLCDGFHPHAGIHRRHNLHGDC